LCTGALCRHNRHYCIRGVSIGAYTGSFRGRRIGRFGRNAIGGTRLVQRFVHCIAPVTKN
jgi:hypothetical protein